MGIILLLLSTMFLSPKPEETVQRNADKGGYVTFVRNFKGTDVSMVYYKDSGQFAFQEADIEPGRTNSYQVVGEENADKIED